MTFLSLTVAVNRCREETRSKQKAIEAACKPFLNDEEARIWDEDCSNALNAIRSLDELIRICKDMLASAKVIHHPIVDDSFCLPFKRQLHTVEETAHRLESMVIVFKPMSQILSRDALKRRLEIRKKIGLLVDCLKEMEKFLIASGKLVAHDEYGEVEETAQGFKNTSDIQSAASPEILPTITQLEGEQTDHADIYRSLSAGHNIPTQRKLVRPISHDEIDRSTLRENIKAAFNPSELRDELCIPLGVDHKDIVKDVWSNTVYELVEYFARREEFTELINQLMKVRPKTLWIRQDLTEIM